MTRRFIAVISSLSMCIC